MKNARTIPNFYFAAYPLNGILFPAPEKKNNLKIVSRPDGRINIEGSSKVLPMLNPYKESHALHGKQTVAKNGTRIKHTPDHIQESDPDWFTCYE